MMNRTFLAFIRNSLILVLAALSTQLAIAAYKPVDISDITGEQRKELDKIDRSLSKFPGAFRDAFFCIHLGLVFQKDGSQALCYQEGRHFQRKRKYIQAMDKSSCVAGNGKVVNPGVGWDAGWKRGNIEEPLRYWLDSECRDLICIYKKDVGRLVRNTAKYLLMTMPDEERWMLLASMGRMLYNEEEASFNHERSNWRMDCGISISFAKNEGRGYSYLDPVGKAHDIRAYLSDGARASRYWRWRQIVWRCENLVGAKDILALFPDEVKAMRKAYKQRQAGIAKKAEEAKAEQEARNEALANAADEALKELSLEQRRAWLAEHFGFCYTSDGRPAYQAERTANDDALFVDADGKERKLSDVANNSDEKWIAATNAAMIVKYSKQFTAHRKDELEDLACRTAYTILSSMPTKLRQSWFAEQNQFLFLTNMKNPYRTVNGGLESGVKFTFLGSDYGKCLYYDPSGKMVHPVVLPSEWDRRWTLLYYCESLIGIEAINSLFPDEVNAMREYFEESSFLKAYKKSLAEITKKAEKAMTEQEARNEALVNAADAMLKELSPEQRRAWMAEHLGFCYTSDGRPAYQSERTANDDALFVDADGKERKLSDVANKSDEKWIAATNAAIIVNYNEQFIAHRKDELKDLAEKSAHAILASMPAELRQTWLAEVNLLLFLPDGRKPYPDTEVVVKMESGATFHHFNPSGERLYYSAGGKITKGYGFLDGNRWGRRWHLLFLCENVAGIEAINASFEGEVNAMREHFKKSPFSKK